MMDDAQEPVSLLEEIADQADGLVSRRGFIGLSLAAGGTLFVAACGGSSKKAATTAAKIGSAKTGTVNVFTWETYTEQPWLAAYGTQHPGVKFNRVVTGSVDEMFAKTRAGSIKFDLLYFDCGSIKRYRDAKLISPLDASKVANASHIAPGLPWKKYNIVNGQTWALPYNWGTQPLMYNADVIKTPPTSWAILWDPKYKGKVSMPDDAYISLPMVSLYLKQKDPFNLNDQGFKQLKDALTRLRPQVKAITAGFNDQQNLFASGDAVVGYNQNISEVFNLQAAGHNVQYTFPDEGTPTWIDNSVITPHGQRQEVYDFINETLSLPWQGRFINFSYNNGVLTNPEAKQAKVKSSVLKKTNIPDQTKPGFWAKLVVFNSPENFDKRLQIWNEFKAGI
jgi:spermidine/putrescine transport system substrate-binding protein